MPGLKRLSGAQLIAIFNKFDFEVISQKGSHVKLKRFIEDKPQTLTIPNHKEIDTGTLRAIYNKASKYIDPEELRKYFYSE